MSDDEQNQKVILSREGYRKLREQHKRLGKLLERVEQGKESTQEATNRLLKRLRKGYNLGSLEYNNRSELHQR